MKIALNKKWVQGWNTQGAKYKPAVLEIHGESPQNEETPRRFFLKLTGDQRCCFSLNKKQNTFSCEVDMTPREFGTLISKLLFYSMLSKISRSLPKGTL
jgi:hypothetical protein